jgi:hypothetical protein
MGEGIFPPPPEKEEFILLGEFLPCCKDSFLLTLPKKFDDFPIPSPSRDVTNQTLPGWEKFNNSRPGRVWLVTCRLGTGKSLTFFYSVPALPEEGLCPSCKEFFPHVGGFLLFSWGGILSPFLEIIYFFLRGSSFFLPLRKDSLPLFQRETIPFYRGGGGVEGGFFPAPGGRISFCSCGTNLFILSWI